MKIWTNKLLTLMTRSGVKASWRGGVRSWGVRSGLWRYESRFLDPRGRPRRASSAGADGGSSRRHELTLSTPWRRHPRALNVRGTFKTPALTACSTPPMAAVFLGLVPTILTRGRGRTAGDIITIIITTTTSSSNSNGAAWYEIVMMFKKSRRWWSCCWLLEVLVVRVLILLPKLNLTDFVVVTAVKVIQQILIRSE